jgi:hypothetical protein
MMASAPRGARRSKPRTRCYCYEFTPTRIPIADDDKIDACAQETDPGQQASEDAGGTHVARRQCATETLRTETHRRYQRATSHADQQ